MDGQPATLADFADALSTLFPEVRVKRVIEVRSADAVDEPLTMTLPALWTGLLYDAEACRQARRLVDGPFESLVALGAAVPREGLRARWAGHAGAAATVQELSREVLQLAEDGLRRRHAAGHDDERRYLEPLREVVESGLTPAERTLARWHAAPDAASKLASLRL